jgi:acyl-CoA thioesterase I
MPLYPIIALGDSLTYGYPFGQAMSWVEYSSKELKVPILNQGTNANILQQMLRRLTIDVLDLKPDYCLILGGTNDVYQGVSLELMKSNFSKITERLLEHQILPIVGLPPPLEDAVFEKDLAKYRNWLKKHAREHSLKVIDFYSAFIDPKKKKLIHAYFEDGIHPSSKGYQAMAQAAIKVLKPLLS